MRLIAEERRIATDSEPPNEEIADVHAVEEDEDLLTVELELMTDEEALALAAELDELDLPAIELTQEQALALVAELEAEYDEPGQHYSVEPEEPSTAQKDVQSNEVCAMDKEEQERQEKLKAEEQEMFRLSRAELQKRLSEIDEELELLRIRKEKRRKEQAEYLEVIVQHEQERRERQEKERLKRQEEIEKKRLEREQRLQAMKNPLGFQQQFTEEERPPPPKFVYKTPEEIAREKEQALSERVPPLGLNAACSKEAVVEMAADLQERLKDTYGTLFDLNEKMKKNDKELTELRSRLGNTKVHDNISATLCTKVATIIDYNGKAINQFSGAGRVIATLEEFQKGGDGLTHYL